MLSIVLVTAGDRGQDVLFRHPHIEPDSELSKKDTQKSTGTTILSSKQKNRTQLRNVAQIGAEPLFGMTSKGFARLFCPKASLCGHLLDVEIGNYKFLSFPVQLSSLTKHELTFFNVVFIIPSAIRHLRAQIGAYKLAVSQLARVLEYEQQRCGFISSQVQLMLGVRELIRTKFAALDDTQKQAQQVALIEQCNSEMLARSLLAQHLATVFIHFPRGCAQLQINHWIPLHISLLNPALHPNVPIRPFHSLLLLTSPRALLASLPPDSSPMLLQLIQWANPCLSFRELAQHLSCSLPHLYRLAAHLQFWNLARIIPCISGNTVFVTCHRAEHRPCTFTPSLPPAPSPLSSLSVSPSSTPSLSPSASADNLMSGLGADAQSTIISAADPPTVVSSSSPLALPRSIASSSSSSSVPPPSTTTAPSATTKPAGATLKSTSTTVAVAATSVVTTTTTTTTEHPSSSSFLGVGGGGLNLATMPSVQEQEFVSLFPSWKLADVLARFSVHTKLSRHRQGMSPVEQEQFMAMTIWLLQKRWIASLHQFIHLIYVTPHDFSGASSSSSSPSFFSSSSSSTVTDKNKENNASGSGRGESSSPRSSKQRVLPKTGPSKEQIEALGPERAAFLASLPRDTPSLCLLHQLSIYLNGKYPLEEILWRENVRRSAVRDMLRSCSHLVSTVLVEHEGVGGNVGQNSS